MFLPSLWYLRLAVMLVTGFHVMGGSAAARQDPNDIGQADTVAIVFLANGDTTKATLEIYVYSDEPLTGVTVGMTWDNPDFQIDSAKATTVVSDGFDLVTLFYDRDSLELTNENRRFMVGGVRMLSSGLDGDGIGRRLWATYYLTIAGWGGLADDGVTFDTLTWDRGSDYLFVTQADPSGPQTVFRPIWAGPLIWGNPPSGVSIGAPGLPDRYILGQNYPNPFNPTTQISFDLPRRAWVTLEVFNVLGQVVSVLVDQEMAAGSYIADWDGTNIGGETVSSGVYLYRLRAGDYEQSRKMLLLK